MAASYLQDEVTVSQVMRDFIAVNINEPLISIVNYFNLYENPCLIVLNDENELFGIINEQSISYAKKKKFNFYSTQAWEIATPVSDKISPKATLKEAVEMMVSSQGRQLVVGEGESIDGILTPLDLIELIDWSESRDITIPNYKS